MKIKQSFYGLLALLLVACNPSSPEQEALDFLYRYMPLPDSVDYPREYWERCVQTTLQAREEMPWGKTIPEREWKHFVLPVRVNNENLDDARTVFYHELKDRVKGMSMYDAVLEVNHWCHEHVTYQPSDSRTSSPLATLRSAIGRCGEESTFTVSALRAVGIPARQVYTPRWAHTDNNHAWVEAWVDGTWYFLGACEPEPVLNLGWFNAPASRGLLMHTKAFGHYDGPEEVMSRTDCYTEINVTENYAPVSTLGACVVDETGAPVKGARVDFRVYNYAEFFNLVSKTTDEAGTATLTCGLGDLLVWAAKDGKFGLEKASVGKDSVITVVLDKEPGFTGTFEYDVIPPPERNNLPEVTKEQQAENKRRFAYEDSVRQAYMDQAFYRPAEGEDAYFLVHARANHPVIAQFLKAHPTEGARRMLQTLRSKDFRDVTSAVLEDHFAHTNLEDGYFDEWARHFAALRVANEMLTAWRGELGDVFSDKDVQGLIQWTKDSIRICEKSNPQRLCMSPLGVYRNRVTDSHSRNIFFVAATRSMGVPARIDEVTGKVQYAEGTRENWAWRDVEWEATSAVQPPQGILCLKNEGPTQPEFATHYSLARITDDCNLQLQDYEMNPAAAQRFFTEGQTVDAAPYLLTTGTRLANGGVLARLEFFGVAQDETVSVPALLRHDDEEVQVIGSFDSEIRYLPLGKTDVASILSTTGRGYYVIGFLKPGDEPTNHALRDMSAVKQKLEDWGRPIVLLTTDGVDLTRFLDRPEFQGLPSTVSFGSLDRNVLDKALKESRIPLSGDYPIIFITDTFNRVVWCSQGYTIGVGELILKIANKL